MKRKGTVPVAPQSSSRKPQCQSYVGYESPLVILLGGHYLGVCVKTQQSIADCFFHMRHYH